ncbi:formylmethanofuran dehydrogenase subunit B [Methanofollis formosanus]|uniref:Formylmethanofuran dehydrogenase subunit B n=1 Tax=Methanofollis formosanus TaxID=299308 RepID=A0A8G1A251_9EURY|nr:formylmethanofuran dehydrogenase subunit B [Methanofollis formosanus]QYZ79046.1 formylmethanofuran dehydrogenase subunit B [Methanofollis formosanus]
MAKIISDVVCPFCGTLCDDLEVKVSDDGKEILEVYNACVIGTEKFLHSQAKDRLTVPMKQDEEGNWNEVSVDDAVEYTAQMLCNAKKPLMYGWSSTNCEAQSKGHEIAELVGGVVDNTATVCHGTTLIAVQDVGVPSCTLGEVKNRADRIVFWGCNPAHAHPRHMSRYSIFPRGFFTGKGHKARKMVVVDPRSTDTAKMADLHMQIEQGRDYELLSALRVAIRGNPLPETVAGIPRETIQDVAETLKSGRFVVIFFGMGVTQSLSKNHNIDIAIALTRDLNDYTKAAIMPMRGHYNVTGSGQVLGWQFGYPFCVDLSRGFARYNPGDSTSNDLLRRGEVDAVFVLGSDPGAHFPISSVKKIAQLPSVCVEPHYTPTTAVCKLHMPVAFVGVEEGGCAYRMDNVPIETRKVVEPPEGMLSDEEFLERVLERVKEIKGVA